MKINVNNIGINVQLQGSGELALVFLHYYGGHPVHGRATVGCQTTARLPSIIGWAWSTPRIRIQKD